MEHGQYKTRLYRIWKDMKTRCYNPSYNAYSNYGGRGINVCEDWKFSFVAFYKWAMANGYSEELTLDRKNNNGDYSPSNCRWVNIKTQANNRRTNHLIEYNGEIHTIAIWADLLGLKKNTLTARLSRGWSIERALTTKIK